MSSSFLLLHPLPLTPSPPTPPLNLLLSVLLPQLHPAAIKHGSHALVDACAALCRAAPVSEGHTSNTLPSIHWVDDFQGGPFAGWPTHRQRAVLQATRLTSFLYPWTDSPCSLKYVYGYFLQNYVLRTASQDSVLWIHSLHTLQRSVSSLTAIHPLLFPSLLLPCILQCVVCRCPGARVSPLGSRHRCLRHPEVHQSGGSRGRQQGASI